MLTQIYRLIPLLCIAFPTFAQQTVYSCGSERRLNDVLHTESGRLRLEAWEQSTYEHLSARDAQATALKGIIRTVPVVVHIVHDNGPENLSDAAITQGIAWVNDALANAGTFQQGSGADTEIRLCLAQRTPDNQSTNGITHTQSPLTNLVFGPQDALLKNTIRWEPKDYLNIWVVRDICEFNGDCSIGGYTAPWILHGEDEDGIVVEAHGWGTDPDYTAIIAHEVGHYFGLYHTFQGGCANENCLLQGDRVCDTPPDQSVAAVPCGTLVNSCTTDLQSGPFSTDQSDMTWNFMDYGTFACMHDFTAGQALRMNEVLSTVRASLLESKGCRPPCPSPPNATFTASATSIPAGETVQFSVPFQNFINYQWTLNGVPFGTGTASQWTFSEPGTYAVSLIAYPNNSTLCDTAISTQYIEVYCPIQPYFTVDNLYFAENETIHLHNLSQGLGTTEWLVNGVSQGPVLDSIAFAEHGTYTLTLIMANGTCSRSFSLQVYVNGACDYLTYTVSVKQSGHYNYIQEAIHAIQLADQHFVIATTGDSALFFHKISPSIQTIWCKKADLGFKLDSTISSQISALILRATPDNGFVALFPKLENTEARLSHLAKFSASGEWEWGRTFADSVNAHLNLSDIKITQSGDIVVCGAYDPFGMMWAKLDMNGNLLWQKHYRSTTLSVDLNAIIELPSGSFVALGKRNASIAIGISPGGDLKWKKSFHTGISPTYRHQAYYDAAENAIYYNEGGRLFIKLDTSANLIWARSVMLGNSPYEFQHCIPLDNGHFAFTAWGCFLVTDKEANPIWVRKTGATVYSGLIFNAAEPGFLKLNAHSLGYNLTKTDLGGFFGQCEQTGLGMYAEDQPVTSFFHGLVIQPNRPLIATPALQVTDVSVTFDTICAPACPRTDEICNNGIDDDLDGMFDCFDEDCPCFKETCKQSKRNNHWYFGTRNHIDFNFEPPMVDTTWLNSNLPYSVNSAISDENGQLLFYTDGSSLFDRNHSFMLNGDGAGGLIVPHPGNNQLFFTFGSLTVPPAASVVDMTLVAGFGGVSQEIPLDLSSATNIYLFSAVGSCNNDYWVAGKYYGSNKFLMWHVDTSGLNATPVINTIGTTNGAKFKFSPDGKYLALTSTTPVPGVYLFDFNTTTGLLSNQRFLPTGTPEFFSINAGLEFSADGRFLYSVFPLSNTSPTKSVLFQFDLENNSTPYQEVIGPGDDLSVMGDLQLAPDGKIYLAPSSIGGSTTYAPLSVILSPEKAGAACNFQSSALNNIIFEINGALCNAIASDLYRPSLSFLPDAPDTICAFEGISYAYKVRTGACTNTPIQWMLEGIEGAISAQEYQADIVFQAPGSGRLIATLNTPCGILADTLPITILGPLNQTLSLGPDQWLCDNGVTELHAGSYFTHYQWSTASVDSVITTLFPGKYWVDVWDACGNKQSDTLYIRIAPETNLDLGPDVPATCPGTALAYHLPTGFHHWNWSPNSFLNCNDCAQVVATPITSTQWIVNAQTAEGCISTDTLRINITDSLLLTLDTFVCANQTLTLYGTQLPPDTTAIFLLPNDAIGCDTILTVNVLGVEAASSTLNVRICPDTTFLYEGIALRPDTSALFHLQSTAFCDSTVQVNVTSYPTLSLSLPADTSIHIGASVQLNAQISGAGPFNLQWSPPDQLDCTQCLSPVAAPFDTIIYSLAVADANGCSSSESVTVYVNAECRIRVPNAFTPNGNQSNDLFRPLLDPCVHTVRFWRITDRWGHVVFERSALAPGDPALDWDGNTDGKPHASDVLIWQMEYELYDGSRRIATGEVTLIR